MVDNAQRVREVAVPGEPALGSAWFYLARSAESCNLKAGGSWGQVGEANGRDGGIAEEGAACDE